MVQTISGVNKNMWKRRESGLYAPERRLFPIDSLVVYVPLWHPELSGVSFRTKDLNGLLCAATNSVHIPNLGRTFNKVDSRIIIAHHASQLLVNGGTILAWVNATSLGENNQGRIVDKSTAGAAANGFCFQVGAGDALQAYINGSGATSQANAFSLSSWFLAELNFDSNGETNMYVDLVNVNGTTPTSAASGITTTAGLYIGNRSALSVTWDGSIGEVAIFNKILTRNESSHYRKSTKWRYT